MVDATGVFVILLHEFLYCGDAFSVGDPELPGDNGLPLHSQ